MTGQPATGQPTTSQAPGQPQQSSQLPTGGEADGDKGTGAAPTKNRGGLGILPGFLLDPVSLGQAAVERATRIAQTLNPEDSLAMFLLYLFPQDTEPQPAREPRRQVAAPPVEADFAPGLRFPPGDHPNGDLIDTAPPAAGPGETRAGLPFLSNAVAALTIEHDPLGGMHERDWERRFVVRGETGGAHAEYAWPPAEMFPEGASSPDATEPAVLAAGTVIDRFGEPHGRVLATDGTPYPQRSLPPEHAAHGYHRYRAEQPLPVWRTVSAGWFGQPGGGERIRLTHSVADLVALGVLTEITGNASACGLETVLAAPAPTTSDPAEERP